MSKLVILHCYPTTDKHLAIVKECLQIFKKTKYDTLLMSHYPIPSDVHKEANYYLFDEDNELLPGGIFPPYFYDLGHAEVTVKYPGHTLPITRSMNKSIKFAKALGYDFFYFMEADCLLSEEDLIKFDDLRYQVFANNKQMIFFKPENFREHYFGSHVYETLIFGGRPEFFIEKFHPPLNVDEWLLSNMSHMLEYDFYCKFKEFEDQFVIVNDHSSNYFDKSQINIFRYNVFMCELLDNGSDYTMTLFMINAFYNNSTYKTSIKLNGIETQTPDFCLGCWWHHDYNLNGDTLTIDIIEDDKIIETKTFLLTKETLFSISNFGKIKFK